MKPILKVLLSIFFGLGAFLAGGMSVTATRHMKGKDGYVVPSDINLIDRTRMEPDHWADFLAALPFYIGLLTFIILIGYATITTMRSMKRGGK